MTKKLLYVNPETNVVAAWANVHDSATVEEYAASAGNQLLYLVEDIPASNLVLTDEELLVTYYDGTTFTFDKQARVKNMHDKIQEFMNNIDDNLGNAEKAKAVTDELEQVKARNTDLEQKLQNAQEAIDFLLLG